MKPIHQAWCIQIEVTNACPKRCAHCTRAVRHVRKPYFMSLAMIEAALQSMEGWPRVVGCMGGEPTIHPQFEDICRLYQRYFPRQQCGLWTSGGPAFEKHKRLILETFHVLLYNDHTEVGQHQPWLIAIDEVIDDPALKNKLIDECWVQKLWSPSINPNGAFFCEIAAVMDLLWDMGGGFDVVPGWWRRDVCDFQGQRNRYCDMCSMALPFEVVSNDCECDYVSPKNKERLVEIMSPWMNRLKVVKHKITTRDIKRNLQKYAPWDYLGESKKRDNTGFIKPGYAEKREHTPISL